VLEELEAVLGTLEFEHDGGLMLASARWPGRACELLLDVRTGDDEVPRQGWRVVCADYRASRLTVEWVQTAELVAEHPLLLAYTQPYVQLAFVGRANDARLVVADLWEAHRSVTDLWHPFEAFFNMGLPLAELLASSSGILAEGPRPLLERYASVLHAHGMTPSLFGERSPKRWLDGAWQAEPSDLRALILGDSYVVGAGFEVERVDVEVLDRNG
jgi:hypothetical protein